MTDVTINYNTEDISKIIYWVNDYNKLPESKRGLNLDICNNLVGNGIQLASSDLDTDANIGTEYLLMAVPEWADDLDELDSISDEDTKEMFDYYYEDDPKNKPKDMWKSDVKITVLVHDWATMTSSHMTLDEFRNTIIKYIDIDLTFDQKEGLIKCY